MPAKKFAAKKPTTKTVKKPANPKEDVAAAPPPAVAEEALPLADAEVVPAPEPEAHPVEDTAAALASEQPAMGDPTQAIAAMTDAGENKPRTDRTPATPAAKMERRVMRRVRQGLASGLTHDEVLAVIDGLRAKVAAERVA